MKVHGPEHFIEGDTWEIQGNLAYADGTPFNLGAGCAIVWAIEDANGNVVLELSLAAGGIVVLDAAAGQCLVTTSSMQSAAVGIGTYTDQLRATDPSGYVSTQWSGPIIVEQSFFS
jgi:hypothetical protein